MAKILVFTSYGGGGHISASQAIADYLSSEHEIIVVPFFIDVLTYIDPVKLITFKKFHVEDIYNFLLRRRLIKAIHAIYFGTQYIMPILTPVMKQLTRRFIKKIKPDLIISVIPVVNHCIMAIAQEYNIPFLLVPTDLDSSTFLARIQQPTYKKFMLSLPYAHDGIFDKIAKAGLPSNQCIVNGFPIRSSFFQLKNVNCIKEALGIDQKKPVILLMMGAEGSSDIIFHIKELIKLNLAAHILILVGRNNALGATIKAEQWPDHLSYSIIGFTDDIAQYMAIADICLTKSGSVSVSECLYVGLPVILDGVGTPLLWEEFNLGFIQQNKFGYIIKSYSEINTCIEQFLTDEQMRRLIKDKIKSFSPIKFHDKIRDVTQALLS